MHRLGDVVLIERFGVLIDGIGLLGIAMKTHMAEFGASHQARHDICHANIIRHQIGAQTQRELFDKGFAGAIDIAARIGITPGGAADIDDGAFVARHHAGQ